jgi:hypothetical protein
LRGQSGRSEGDLQVEIAIDCDVFPARLSFGDDCVVFADTRDGQIALSRSLLDETQRGRSMTMRLDLLDKPKDQAARFGGEIVVDLSARQSAIAGGMVRFGWALLIGRSRRSSQLDS